MSLFRHVTYLLLSRLSVPVVPSQCMDLPLSEKGMPEVNNELVTESLVDFLNWWQLTSDTIVLKPRGRGVVQESPSISPRPAL